MKLAIYTISDDNNFGNRLQNYALQVVLNKHFGPTLTLQDRDSKKNYYSLMNEMKLSPFLLPLKVAKHILREKNVSHLDSSLNVWRRQRLFRDFTKKYVPKFRNRGINDAIDCFVIGSDQIWNPHFRVNLENDFLSDIKHKKVISYAASVGLDKLSRDEIKIFDKGLKSLDAISVREFSAQQMLHSHTDKNIVVSIDPTMLLTFDDWHKLSQNANQYVRKQQKFLITYFLGEITTIESEYISRFANAKQLQIINISDKKSDLYTKIGPLEFLWLFDNTEAVFADSYHAAVFSIIFKKYFEIFERHDSLSKMNTRMFTLFKHFEIENRMHNVQENMNFLPDVDYNKIDKKLESKQKEALNWVTLNLGKSDY